MNESQTNKPSPQEELFQEWKRHPVTKQLLTWATKERESLKEQWAAGNFSAAFSLEMAVKNAGATGYCNCLATLLDMDYDTLEGYLHDAE